MAENETKPATECECALAGYCQRHQCHKTPHWYHLCQTSREYFQLWEQRQGPGQHSPQEPGVIRKGANFGKAVVRHLANKRRIVPDEVYYARLSVCRSCGSLDRKRMVCRERNCGCHVERKARWESEDCPLGKWPPGADETDVDSNENMIPAK